MTIKSGLYIICFEVPDNKRTEIKFKIAYSVNINSELQKYLNFFDDVILIAQLELNRSMWVGRSRPIMIPLQQYIHKIFCLFCDIYKLNHSGYFYSSVEKVYEMMRFFSKEMLIDSKICLHTIDSDNNTHLKAMKVLSSEKKNPVNNHRFENKKIVVEFN